MPLMQPRGFGGFLRVRGRNVVAGDDVPRKSELTLVIGNGSAGEDMELEDLDDIDDSGLSDFGGDEVDDFLEVDE